MGPTRYDEDEADDDLTGPVSRLLLYCVCIALVIAFLVGLVCGVLLEAAS